MFGFTIVLSVAIAMQDVVKFRAVSRGEFNQQLCLKRASEYADKMIGYAQRRAPHAILNAEVTCEHRITRPT